MQTGMNVPPTDAAIIFLFFISVPGVAFVLLYGWARWGRDSERFGQPRWQGVAAFVGLTLASLSAIVCAGLVVWGELGEHGWIINSRVGGTCALMGIGLAIVGKGKLRLPGMIASVIQLSWWVALFVTVSAKPE